MAKRECGVIRKMKKSGIRAALTREFPFFMITPALIWQLLFFFVPFTIIVSLSVLSNCELVFGKGFSLQHYVQVFDFPHFNIIARSLLFAFFNALFCFLCAYPVAYFLARKLKRGKNFLLFLLMLPFWTNALVQIYAWFFVLERNGLLNTILLKSGFISQPLHFLNSSGSIFLVMVYCYLPFMIMPLYNVLDKLDERLIESSYDLGANGWQTFIKVTMPLSWSGIKTGFFLVFVPSFGEFVIPALMGGSKKMFVGSLISHYFLTANDVQSGAAFTCLSGGILLLIAVILNWYFGKKAGIARGH